MFTYKRLINNRRGWLTRQWRRLGSIYRPYQGGLSPLQLTRNFCGSEMIGSDVKGRCFKAHVALLLEPLHRRNHARSKYGWRHVYVLKMVKKETRKWNQDAKLREWDFCFIVHFSVREKFLKSKLFFYFFSSQMSITLTCS